MLATTMVSSNVDGFILIAHLPSFTKEKYLNETAPHRLVSPGDATQAIGELARRNAHGMNVPVWSK